MCRPGIILLQAQTVFGPITRLPHNPGEHVYLWYSNATAAVSKTTKSTLQQDQPNAAATYTSYFLRHVPVQSVFTPAWRDRALYDLTKILRHTAKIDVLILIECIRPQYRTITQLYGLQKLFASLYHRVSLSQLVGDALAAVMIFTYNDICRRCAKGRGFIG